MKNLYFAHIEWANEYDDWKEKSNDCFIIADSYADAANRISNDYDGSDIVKMEIKAITWGCDCNVLYVPDDPHLIQAIIDENSY